MYYLIIASVFTFLGLIPVQIVRSMYNWSGAIVLVASVVLFSLGLAYADKLNSRSELNFAKTLGVCCGLTCIAAGIWVLIYCFLWFISLFG